MKEQPRRMEQSPIAPSGSVSAGEPFRLEHPQRSTTPPRSLDHGVRGGRERRGPGAINPSFSADRTRGASISRDPLLRLQVAASRPHGCLPTQISISCGGPLPSSARLEPFSSGDRYRGNRPPSSETRTSRALLFGRQ